MVTAFQKFYETIHVESTRKTYQIYIKKFMDYANENYDSLVTLPQCQIEDLVFNYVIHLKDLTERTGTPSPNSYNTMTSPIKLFLDVNDILLNWVKIKKYFPAKNQLQINYHIQTMILENYWQQQQALEIKHSFIF